MNTINSSTINSQDLITESSVSSLSQMQKLEVYNLIRGSVLGCFAHNPVDKPNSAVFGKIRTIGGQSALEYSQTTFKTAVLEESTEYTPGQKFRYAQGVYEVLYPVSFTGDSFEISTQLITAEQAGIIRAELVETDFGISKLAIQASTQASVVRCTQEMLQDMRSLFGDEYATKILMDAVAASVSERVNREGVRMIEATAVKGTAFSGTNDYDSARKLVAAIHTEALQVQKDTGNVCTYVLVTPAVEALIMQSGLVDEAGFIGELEVIGTRFYHETGKEYFVTGFARSIDGRSVDTDGVVGEAPYDYGSYIFAPYIEEIYQVLDTESFSKNIRYSTRFSISCAPYKEEKTFKRGDVAQEHTDANLNARLVAVTIA